MILNTSDRIMYDRLCGSGGALEAAAVASKDTSLYVIAGHREGVTQRTRSSVSTKRTVADIEHTRRVDLRWGGQRTPTHTTLGDIGGDRMFIPMLWAAETHQQALDAEWVGKDGYGDAGQAPLVKAFGRIMGRALVASPIDYIVDDEEDYRIYKALEEADDYDDEDDEDYDG